VSRTITPWGRDSQANCVSCIEAYAIIALTLDRNPQTFQERTVMRLAIVLLSVVLGVPGMAAPVEKNAKIGPGLDAELNIHGYVMESGSKVAGVTVILFCPRTNFKTETATNSSGKYSFSKLPPF
jgi:hypothetical protein